RMVREVAVIQPVLPMVSRPDQTAIGVVVVGGGRDLAPREGEEQSLAVVHEVPAEGSWPFESEVAVSRKGQFEVDAVGPAHPLVVAGAGVFPLAADPAVVEHRLAVLVELSLAVPTAHEAHEGVV